MSKPEAKKRRKQFAKEECAIRKIINDWKPIGFPTPEDEYDCLVHQLLSILHSGGTQQEIAAKIKSVLQDYFGLSRFPEKEISAVADRVWNCWQDAIIND